MRENDQNRRGHPEGRAFGAGVPNRSGSAAGEGDSAESVDEPGGVWERQLADFRPVADPAFARALRRDFIAGSIVVPDESDGLVPEVSDGSSPAVDRLLAGWAPARASESARARAFAALTGGGADRVDPIDSVQEEHTAGRPRAAVAPEPARRMSTRLRLVAGAGLLAAAAAVVLAVRSLGGDDAGTSPNLSPDAPSESAVAWAVDVESSAGGSAEALLEDVRLDGQRVESIDALAARLETATTISVGAMSLRVRRGDDFVLDLGPGTELEFVTEGVAPAISMANRRALLATSGSVRIATGPAFDAGVPLVIATPHVRASVVGTIFGVDVEDGYTCVCCLEGEVRVSRAVTTTAASDEEREVVSIGTGTTGLAMEDEEGIQRVALIEAHSTPLRALRDAY